MSRPEPAAAAAAPAAGRGFWLRLAALLVAAGLARQLLILFATWSAGGHGWIQGDWLIGLAAGPVRRGPFGEVLLAFADATGASPLALVVAIQVLLIVALSALLIRLILIQPGPDMALAVLTPALFALAWAADPASGGRKEMFGLLALLLLALPGGGGGRLLLSAALLSAGALGHEVNVLLWPVWAACLFLFPRPGTGHLRTGLMLATAAAAAAAGAYALAHPTLASAEALCTALTDRGLVRAQICGGAIDWMARPDNGPAKVAEALGKASHPYLLPFAAPLWLAPPLRLLFTRPVPRSVALAVAAAVLPLCALYPVALDWGRWLTLQTSALGLVALGLGARGHFGWATRIGRAEMLLWTAGALLWGPLHRPDVLIGGFLAGVP